MQGFAAVGKDADEDADCGDHQKGAKDRINAADDLVNGEYSRRDVVNENQSVDKPDHPGVASDPAADRRYLLQDIVHDQVAWRVDKHNTYQHQ
jgi:hypothetical protein